MMAAGMWWLRQQCDGGAAAAAGEAVAKLAHQRVGR